MKPVYIMIGGFPGAGKTTTVAQLATYGSAARLPLLKKRHSFAVL